MPEILISINSNRFLMNKIRIKLIITQIPCTYYTLLKIGSYFE